MSVTVYKNVSFEGVFAQLGPGFYSGKDLAGCPHQSTSCEDLDNAINSLRVDPNIVVAFADGHSISASGGGARVLIGPAEVSDLTALGMSNRISSVLVVPYRAYDSAIPAPGGGVTLYDSFSLTGRRSSLRRGEYSKARLASEEVKMPGKDVVSVEVAAHVLAILYNGDNFETTMDAVMVVGPTLVEDLERLGMSGRVNSIRVLYSDPFDVPRPSLPLGSARAYTPGGALGYSHGRRISPPRPALTPGALDLLMPRSSDPSSPSNWAGSTSRARPPAAPAAPAPPQAPAPPTIIIVEPPRKETLGWRLFALIVIFIAIVAFAAYMSGRAAKSPEEKEAAEANLVAQAGIPMAVTAALV